MTVDRLQDLFNKGGKAQKVRGAKAMGADFGGMLDAVSAMGPTVTTTNQMYGSTGAPSAVLAAAFSGINAASAQGLGGMGGGGASLTGGSALADYTSGVPSFASGGMGGMSGGPGAQTVSSGSLGGLNSNAPVVAGTEGFSQMDMINTMNQNNLQLLELQAVMQSNMQSWNTKSNILSADHRARMAMIEKFTARG
ncbi:MAG: hypothetical protein WC690_00105 [bacterium]